jgi:hypothetical protein
MDFAFVPGQSLGEKLAAGMLQRRPQTTLLQVRRMATIGQFIKHLNTASGITRPIDNILIASHAVDEGMMFIPAFAGQSGSTKFETLENSLSNAAHSIKIPDTLIGHTPNTPPTKFFHIRGCNIGKARPFLVKLREALGDNVTVTAPIHSDRFLLKPSLGVWEYMWYEYKIVRPTVFPNRSDAVTAFENNTSFKRIDGSAVPKADWQKNIPASILKTDTLSITVNLGVTVAKRTTLDANGEFRVHEGKFDSTITFPNAGQVPTTNSAQMTVLQQFLAGQSRFDTNHPFPENKRWGYASLTDFIAGWDWKFQKNGKKLVCSGRRVEYTVFVPIVNVTTGNLIFNFYPNAGSSQAAITSGLVETDAHYFLNI